MLTNADATTQLFDAVEAADLVRVKHLLSGVTGPDIVSKFRGVLHVAAENGCLYIVRYLVAEAARRHVDKALLFDFGNESEETALHKAASASIRNSEKPGLKSRYSEVIEYLIREGADPTIKDAQGRTPWDICQSKDDKYQLGPWRVPSVGAFALHEMGSYKPTNAGLEKWFYQDGKAASLHYCGSNSKSWIYVPINAVRITLVNPCIL